MQAQMRASKFNTLVTTYEYIIKDKAVLSKVFLKLKFQKTLNITEDNPDIYIAKCFKGHLFNQFQIRFRSAGST
jgi:hypothetical protein